MSIKNLLCIAVLSSEVMALSACISDKSANDIAGLNSPATQSALVKDRAFTWTAEKGIQLIPQPTYAESVLPQAINNRGDVVGALTLHDGNEQGHAFIWSASAGMQRLGSLIGLDGISIALAVNDDGEVRGLSEGPSTQRTSQGIYLADGFAWAAGAGMTPRPYSNFGDAKSVSEGGKLIMPAGAECMQVLGTSPSGLAVGYAGFTVSPPETCHSMTTLMWELDGTPVIIDQCDTRRNCTTAGVRDINDNGVVIGFRNNTGFRWTRSGGFVNQSTTLVSLTSINENGDAAGSVTVGYFLFKPVVWMASGELKIIDLPAGFSSGYATGLNDKGQVVGTFERSPL
jgi:probable HAF family extracellular repeat protein